MTESKIEKVCRLISPLLEDDDLEKKNRDEIESKIRSLLIVEGISYKYSTLSIAGGKRKIIVCIDDGSYEGFLVEVESNNT